MCDMTNMKQATKHSQNNAAESTDFWGSTPSTFPRRVDAVGLQFNTKDVIIRFIQSDVHVCFAIQYNI